MKRFFLFICFALNTCLLSYSNIPLYDEANIQSIHLIRETTSTFSNNVKPTKYFPWDNRGNRNANKTKWTSCYISVPDKKLCSKWVLSDERPKNFLQPIGKQLLLNGVSYTFINYGQSVVKKYLTSSEVATMMDPFGQHHDGIYLQEHIQKLSNSEFKHHEDGIRSFWMEQGIIRAARYYINDENRIIKRHMYPSDTQKDDPVGHNYEQLYFWAEVDGFDFWYPELIETRIDHMNGEYYESKSWIREIEFNIELPNDVFILNHPGIVKEDNY